MKKSELKQNTAYLVTSRGARGYSSSIYNVTQSNLRERRFIIFSEGVPTSPRQSNSMVYVTSCPTFGDDCQIHTGTYPSGFPRSCHRETVRLMDIKGEFYPLMADIARRYRERNADGGRGQRYLEHVKRKQQREREAIAKPIKEQMYEAINAITGATMGGYYGTDLSRLTLDQMSALTEALNAGRKVGA